MKSPSATAEIVKILILSFYLAKPRRWLGSPIHSHWRIVCTPSYLAFPDLAYDRLGFFSNGVAVFWSQLDQDLKHFRKRLPQFATLIICAHELKPILKQFNDFFFKIFGLTDRIICCKRISTRIDDSIRKLGDSLQASPIQRIPFLSNLTGGTSLPFRQRVRPETIILIPYPIAHHHTFPVMLHFEADS